MTLNLANGYNCISKIDDIGLKVNGVLKLDVAKRAGRVGFGSGQSGLRVKRVTGQNGSFLNGLTGLLVNWVSGRVGSGRVIRKFIFSITPLQSSNFFVDL